MHARDEDITGGGMSLNWGDLEDGGRWRIPSNGGVPAGAGQVISLNAGAGGGVWIGEGGKRLPSEETAKMRLRQSVILLFGMLFGCASLLYAQTPAGNSVPVIPAPKLSKLNVSSTLQQMQTAAAEGNAEAPSPLQIVVQFLQLQPPQQAVFGQLLQARQTAVAPLFQAIAQKEQQLEALVENGGNPLQVGILVIQIHALQQQVVQTQQAFLANFANLLDQDQQERLAAAAVGAQLEPVIPAFQQLQLF
jgi:hypothetical protein